MAVTLLVAACSADDGQDGQSANQEPDTYGRLGIRIALPEASSQTRTISGTEWEEGATEERAINSYYLLICNGNQIVEAIKGGSATSESHDNTKNHYISSAEIESKALPTGTYTFTIYCLANFTDDMLAEAGLTVSGGTISDTTLPSGFEEKAITIANTAGIPSGGIPMTGKLEKTVTISSGTTDLGEPIVLWRAMAKVEFRFFSAATTDVKVTKIKLHHITNSPVYLLSKRELNQDGSNRDTYSSDYLPQFPVGNQTAAGYATTDYEYTLPDGGLNVGTSITSETQALSTSLYINESKADDISQKISFTLTTERTASDGTTKTVDENYLLTDLAFILRNDHVIIPVCFTDYIFSPAFALYPPIGGYPDSEITETDNTFYYQVTPSDDEFIVIPNLYNSLNNERIAIASSKGGTAQNIVNWDYTLSEGLTLTEEPQFINDNVIKGTFKSGKEGTITFTFTFDNGTFKLERKVYIVIKNKN